MKYINKILRINTLVKLRATGSPRDLASKLGISERSVYEYINNMKELGAPIAFSYSHNSYVYYKDGELVMSFSPKKIESEEAQEIFGGCYPEKVHDPLYNFFMHHETLIIDEPNYQSAQTKGYKNIRLY